MSAARAWTRGVGRLLFSAGAAGGKERAPKRTPAGTSPAPPGVVASLRSLAPSHKVRKTRLCFVLRGETLTLKQHQDVSTACSGRYWLGPALGGRRHPS